RNRRRAKSACARWALIRYLCYHSPMRSLIAPLSLLLLISFTRAGTVDPPLPIKVSKLDRSELSGRITSYSDDGLEVMDLKKQTSKVAWEELSPDAAVNVFSQVSVHNKVSGDEWMKLGQKLLTMPGGR